MKIPQRLILRALAAFAVLLICSTASAAETAAEKCEKCAAVDDSATVKPAVPNIVGSAMAVPDVPLFDDNGKSVKLSDLTDGKIVALSFIFTTCKTICLPIGANFSQLEKFVAEDSLQDKVALISISIDPLTDTPARLKDWKTRLGGGEGWTLLTGRKPDVDKLLKQLEVFTANKIDHSPWVLIGDPATGQWRRENGLASADALRKSLNAAVAKAASVDANNTAAPTGKPVATDSAKTNAAEKYFTNTELIDQNGESRRLYRDLMHGKIVVVNSFFSSCPGACPIMMKTFSQIQETAGDRMGKDVHLLSITVDPANDTPDRLKEFALSLKARDGWYFLTGPKAQVDTVLAKLGLTAEQRESHSNVFLIGNTKTGLWKKAMGLAKADEVVEVFKTVLNDQGK